jgi:hypothetical protein
MDRCKFLNHRQVNESHIKERNDAVASQIVVTIPCFIISTARSTL